MRVFVTVASGHIGFRLGDRPVAWERDRGVVTRSDVTSVGPR